MEFLVEFEVSIPDDVTETEVKEAEDAEAAAAGGAGARGTSCPGVAISSGGRWGQSPWAVPRRQCPTTPRTARRSTALPLDERECYDARTASQRPRDGLRDRVTRHGACRPTVRRPIADRKEPFVNSRLPDPRLIKVYRLEVTLGPVLDDRRCGIRATTASFHSAGGTFTGPELSGTLLPGASADWQIILLDGTAIGDVRYTLRTERGDLLYVQSRGGRYGSAEVLGRLGRTV